MLESKTNWARPLLMTAVLLSLLASISGIGALLLIRLIVPLFISSYLLYAVQLKRVPAASAPVFGFLVASLGGSLSLWLLTAQGFLRWLPLGWLGYAVVVAGLLRPPSRRAYWLAGLLTFSFWVVPLWSFRHTSLSEPIQANDLLWAKVLFALGADASEVEELPAGFARSASSMPMVYKAVESRQADMLRLLLRHGADPNASYRMVNVYQGQTTYTQSPVLFHALWNKQKELVDLLLAAGANPLLRDNLGRDAVRIARDYDYPDSAAVQRAARRFQARTR